MHPYVHGSIIYNRQAVEITQVPIDWWMDKKMWYVRVYKHRHTHTHGGILVIKKEWTFAICDSMDGLWGHLFSEISQNN